MNSAYVSINSVNVPLSGTSGANVSSAGSIVIKLVNPAGVQSWSCLCSGVDDVTSQSAINATLVQNNTAWTCTFTAPTTSIGATMIFTSITNVGYGNQQIFDFGVFITLDGYRLFAGGEDDQSNATVGNAADLNALVRSVALGGGGGGSFTAGGDLSGSSSSQTVVALNGHLISSSGPTEGQFLIEGTGNTWKPTSLSGDVTASAITPGLMNVAAIQGVVISGTPSSGQVLTATSSLTANWQVSGGFTAGGDLTGTPTSQTVKYIQGVLVSGTPASGYVLEATSATAASWQASPSIFTAGGDLSGTSVSQNVIALNGNTIVNTPHSNYLFVQNGANSGVGYYNLIGDASLAVGINAVLTVTGLQGNAVSAQTLGGTQDGYVLTWDNSDGYWLAKASTGGGGSFTAAGDLGGSGSSQTVLKITGASGLIPVAATGNVLTWNISTTTPGLAQQTQTANGTPGYGQTMTIAAQNATGTGTVGGNLYLQAGTGTIGDGDVILIAGTTQLIASSSGLTFPGYTAAGILHTTYSTGQVTTSLLVNADVSSSAAIAYSKLSLSNSILGTDIATSAAIPYSKLSLANDILNSDIATTAAIAVNKLAVGTPAQLLLNNATPTPTWTSITGDLTLSSTGVTVVQGINGVILGAAPTTGQVLAATSTTTAGWSSATGLFAPGGDLGGASTSQTVLSLTGYSGQIKIASSGNVFYWNAATTSTGLSQAAVTTSSAVGAAMTIQAQDATGTSSTGGALTLASGSGVSANGILTLAAGNVNALTVAGNGAIALPVLTTAGILHNAVTTGAVTSSLIVNADIAAAGAANIAVNKLAIGSSGQLLINNATPTPTWTTLSGDVVVSATGVTSLNSITVAGTSGFTESFPVAQGTAAGQTETAARYVGYGTVLNNTVTILTIPLPTSDTSVACTCRATWRVTTATGIGSAGTQNALILFTNIGGTITPYLQTLATNPAVTSGTSTTAIGTATYSTQVTYTVSFSGTNCLIRLSSSTATNSFACTMVADCIFN